MVALWLLKKHHSFIFNNLVALFVTFSSFASTPLLGPVSDGRAAGTDDCYGVRLFGAACPILEIAGANMIIMRRRERVAYPGKAYTKSTPLSSFSLISTDSESFLPDSDQP